MKIDFKLESEAEVRVLRMGIKALMRENEYRYLVKPDRDAFDKLLAKLDNLYEDHTHERT